MTKEKNQEVEVNNEKKQVYVDLYNEFINRKRTTVPEPKEFFEIGEEITVGNLINPTVIASFDNGKYYIIFDSIKDDDVYNPKNLKCFSWLSIFKKNENDSLFPKERIRISYMQTYLRSLFTYVYDFNLNFDPPYQRDYVWTEEDKQNLLHSIFNYVEIGKFAFIENTTETWSKTGYGYEIMDGKQRLQTLVEFYEGRLTYNGLSYRELSDRDRDLFNDYPVNVGILGELSEKDIYRYFLYMNKHGKVMDKKHLKEIEKKLDKLERLESNKE